jgi:hypothetical protein
MLTAILKKTTVIFALVALARLPPFLFPASTLVRQAQGRPLSEKDRRKLVEAHIARSSHHPRLRVIYRAGASDDQIAAAMSVAAGGWHRSRERRLDPPHHHLAAGLRRLPPYQLGNPLLQSR